MAETREKYNYYRLHKEEVKAQVKAYQESRKEFFKEYHRKYYQEHKDELKEKRREYKRKWDALNRQKKVKVPKKKGRPRKPVQETPPVQTVVAPLPIVLSDPEPVQGPVFERSYGSFQIRWD
jgi:hypothetical protein